MRTCLAQGDWEERGPDLMWVRASTSAIGAIAFKRWWAEGRQNVPHRQIAIYENAISSVSGLPGPVNRIEPVSKKDEPARYIGASFTDRTTSNVLLQQIALRTFDMPCAAPRAVEEGKERDAIEFLNDGSNWRVVARIAKAIAGGMQLASDVSRSAALVMAGLNDLAPWRGDPRGRPGRPRQLK